MIEIADPAHPDARVRPRPQLIWSGHPAALHIEPEEAQRRSNPATLLAVDDTSVRWMPTSTGSV